MGKLAAVIGREFSERVRSRWFLLTTIFGPFLFAALTLGPPWLAFRLARSVDLSAVVIVDATDNTPAPASRQNSPVGSWAQHARQR